MSRSVRISALLLALLARLPAQFSAGSPDVWVRSCLGPDCSSEVSRVVFT